jgi:biopolymer transport protein ExbB/TolQ
MIVQSLLKISLLGATWVLYLMLGLSVISLGSMLERLIFFARNRKASADLDHTIEEALHADDYTGAYGALAKSSSLEARVLREALRWKKGGADAFADALEGALGRARGELDRGATLLGTLGNNTPFIGLFGTVIGVIEAFSHLGGSNAGAGLAKVMGGIAEALIATGVGIFVAIPAVVAYNVIQKKAGDLEGHTQSIAKLFTAWLHTNPDARFATAEAERVASPARAQQGAEAESVARAAGAAE